jgi:hypothetical protein
MNMPVPKNTERPLQKRPDFLAVDFVKAARLLGGQSFFLPLDRAKFALDKEIETVYY